MGRAVVGCLGLGEHPGPGCSLSWQTPLPGAVTVSQCPLGGGSPPGRSVPEGSGLRGCKGDRESKRSKSREQALTADGFCPLLTASCNRPELLPRARAAPQILSQPLPSLLLLTGRDARSYDRSLWAQLQRHTIVPQTGVFYFQVRR